MATTVDYPAVIDTFGCTPQWLKANPKAAQGITDAYFEALDMIRKEPEKAYGIYKRYNGSKENMNLLYVIKI